MPIYGFIVKRIPWTVECPISAIGLPKTTSPNTLSFGPSHKGLLFTSPLTNTHPACLENSSAVQNTQPVSPLK